ncbi:MAG: sulfite exporter TauE/SafE family protein [Gammaproteobacteria bacterium]
MDYWQGGILILVGCVAGFMNVMAGGGSLLSVPVMVFMGMPGPVANGTNRIAILAQNITAVTTFFRKGYADFKLSLTLSLSAIPGAIAGALLGTRLQGVWFNRTLAVIMICVMYLMARKKKPDDTGTKTGGKPKNLLLGHLLMLGVGYWGGFIQMGVGFIIMPVLHRVMGLDLVQVNMHKVFIIGMYSIVALFIFASRVEVLWLLGACLAVGNSIGGWLGVHMSVMKGEGLIRMVLNTILTLFIIKLLFF